MNKSNASETGGRSPAVDLGYLLCIVNRLDREAQLSLNDVECLLQAIAEIKHHRDHVKETTQ